MAHGIILTEDIKNLIAKVYLENRKWPAHKIRAEVIARLHRDEKFQQYVDDPDWPRLSRIQKELHDLKEADENRSAESKALDLPWSILDIAQHPIPPEILPVALEAWGKALLKDDPLTIREVLWVARLYYLFKDVGSKHRIVMLTQYAQIYALDETICRLMLKHPNKPEDMWGDWTIDAELYEGITGDINVKRKLSKEVRRRDFSVPVELVEEAEKRTYRGGTK